MTIPRSFDLIVFDWDGTLYDSTVLIACCIQAACADVGAPVPSLADASYVIGLGLADALRHVAPGLPESRYPELGLRYRHHYFARQHELSLFPGTLEMLHALRALEGQIFKERALLQEGVSGVYLNFEFVV